MCPLRFSLNSEHHNHSLVTVIGGEEEHFEDFGESNTSELLERSVEGTKGEGDSPLTQPLEQVNGSSLLSPRYEPVFPTQIKPSVPESQGTLSDKKPLKLFTCSTFNSF